MNFEYTNRTKELMARLTGFMDRYIYPNEARYYQEVSEGRFWPSIVEELKPKLLQQVLVLPDSLLVRLSPLRQRQRVPTHACFLLRIASMPYSDSSRLCQMSMHPGK